MSAHEFNGKLACIAGASGAIGSHITKYCKTSGADVVTISSTSKADIQADLTHSESVSKVSEWFRVNGVVPDIIICCSGILHDHDKMPEKQLSEIDREWLIKSIEVNVIAHVHLAQALGKIIGKSKKTIWASLSAMVGSIEDNYLGGWYSYRMSKAALNMFIKTLSIEWNRKNKSNKVFAIHPGTTRSEMSRPFRVREDKLYEPSLSSERIISVIADSESYESGQFINWNGQIIPW